MQPLDVTPPADLPVQVRFCQQCGRFQPLSEFDGDKRSCRVRLQVRAASTAAAGILPSCVQGTARVRVGLHAGELDRTRASWTFARPHRRNAPPFCCLLAAPQRAAAQAAAQWRGPAGGRVHRRPVAARRRHHGRRCGDGQASCAVCGGAAGARGVAAGGAGHAGRTALCDHHACTLCSGARCLPCLTGAWLPSLPLRSAPASLPLTVQTTRHFALAFAQPPPRPDGAEEQGEIDGGELGSVGEGGGGQAQGLGPGTMPFVPAPDVMMLLLKGYAGEAGLQVGCVAAGPCRGMAFTLVRQAKRRGKSRMQSMHAQDLPRPKHSTSAAFV